MRPIVSILGGPQLELVLLDGLGQEVKRVKVSHVVINLVLVIFQVLINVHELIVKIRQVQIIFGTGLVVEFSFLYR
jgi:hypothetical protein